jgi:long-chain fatty acid transport protein
MRRVLIVLSIFALSDVNRAFAVNGLQMIGFSAESTALAGSGHVSIADTSSINTNPEALSLIQGTRFDVSAGPLQAFLHHSDGFGNGNVPGEDNVTVLGDVGVATRFAFLPGLTTSTGIFTQGGFGTEFRNLNTAFGTRDDTSSFLRYLKFAVGLSYEATEKLSIGIAPSVGYSDIWLRLFPGTSIPSSPALPNGFASLDIHDRCARTTGLWLTNALLMWPSR